MENSHGLRDFIAGTLSGAAGVICGQPLDTIRVRLQQAVYSSGFATVVVRTVTEEGLHRQGLALFKGMSAPLSAFAFQNAVTFSVYGHSKRWLDERFTTAEYPHANAFFAGAIAGGAQAVLSSPIELVKVRLQLNTEPMNGPRRYGPLHCFSEMWKQSGTKAISRGLTATIVRDTPGYATYFMAYDALKHILGGPDPSPLAIFCAGGLSGSAGWFVVYPTDVVKTKIQSDDLVKPKYRNFLHCYASCYKEMGSKLFTRGLVSTLGRAFLVDGAIFVTFEATQKLFIMNHGWFKTKETF